MYSECIHWVVYFVRVQGLLGQYHHNWAETPYHYGLSWGDDGTESSDPHEATQQSIDHEGHFTLSISQHVTETESPNTKINQFKYIFFSK